MAAPAAPPHERMRCLRQQELMLRQFMERPATLHLLRKVAFPYHYRTITPGSNGSLLPDCLKLTESKALPGLMGVLFSAVPRNNETLRIAYPGYLMTEEVFEQFCKEFHVPTGMEVEDLQYQYTPIGKKTPRSVTVLLVGLPTAAGPILNCSSRFPKDHSHIKGRIASRKPEGLEGREPGAPLISVPDDLVYIEVPAQGRARVESGTEVVWQYESGKGRGTFWRSIHQAYCDVCFRVGTPADPVMKCDYVHEETTGTCSAGRHRRCLPVHPDLAALHALHPELCGDSPWFEVKCAPDISRLGEPCQLGVFAKKLIPQGTKIAFFANDLIENSLRHPSAAGQFRVAKSLPNSKASLDGESMQCMYTRLVPRNSRELKLMAHYPASEFEPSKESFSSEMIAKFHAAPKGFMVNSPAGRGLGKENCRWVHFEDVNQASVTVLKSKEDIQPGAELLSLYNSSDERASFQATQPDEKSIAPFFHRCVLHVEQHHGRASRARRRLAAPAAAGHTVTDNYPPKASTSAAASGASASSQSHAGLQILHTDEAIGLKRNADSLSVQVSRSIICDAGLGLFSKKSFKAKEIVGYFWGAIVSRSRLDQLVNGTASHVSPEEETFRRERESGVEWCIDIANLWSDSEDDYVLLVSKQCPVGYINDPGKAHENSSAKRSKVQRPKVNCEVEWLKEVPFASATTLQWNSIPIRTTEPLPADQEFFFDYGYDVTGRPKAVSSEPHPSPAPHSYMLAFNSPDPMAPENHALYIENVETARQENAGLFKAANFKPGNQVSVSRSLLPSLDASACASLPPRHLMPPGAAAPSVAAPSVPAPGDLAFSAPAPSAPVSTISCALTEVLMEDEVSARQSTQSSELGEDDYRPVKATIDERAADGLQRAEEQFFFELNSCSEADHAFDHDEESLANFLESDDEDEDDADYGELVDDDVQDAGGADGDDDDDDAQHSTLVHNSRVSAPIPETGPQNSIKCIIRPWAATQKLQHLQEIGFSPAEKRFITAEARRYTGIDEAKTSARKKEANAMLEAVTGEKNGLCNPARLAKDFSEVRACCGLGSRFALGAPEGHLEDHAFSSLEKFLEMRLAIAKNAEGGYCLRSSVVTYLRNRSVDPSGLQRCIGLGALRCCQSCFRAVTGLSRSSIFKLNSFVKTGVLGFPQRSYSKPAGGTVVDMVVRLLMKTVNLIGDSVPNPNTKGPTTLYELPFTQRVQLLNHLQLASDLETDPALPVIISRTALYRAVDHFKTNLHIQLSLTSSKRFMKCTTCKKHDNCQRKARGNPEMSEEVRRERRVHFTQVTDQRDHYTKVRELAKKKNSDVMLLTIDGMDQAKTQLPHEVRASKDSDGIPGLPVHVVSVFVFGGLKPIIGFLNYPDVQKNSSLTVTLIQRAIDLQWEEHMKQNGGKLKRWPKRLHICFDNAVGENLNRNVWFYLATLVHTGVFHSITIGTLLVGHTHNINDQLFSVWSTWLNNNSCLTPAQMMKAFADNYSGKSVQEAPEAADPPDPESSAAMVDDDATDFTGDVTFEQDSESARLNQQTKAMRRKSSAQKRKLTLQNEADIEAAAVVAKPHMELVHQNADVAGWLTKERLFGGDKTKGLAAYHVFAFDKDDEGDTKIYYKFLARSDQQYQEVPHPLTLDGEKYRGCRTLLKKADIIEGDPIALPFCHFDTSDVRRLVEQLHDENVTHADFPLWAEELTGICDRLDKQIEDQAEECKECAEIMHGLGLIGTLHKPTKKENPALKLKYDEDMNRRKHLQARMLAHLEESLGQRDKHKKMEGWWTKWTDERVPMIKRYYRSIGLLNDEADIPAAGAAGAAGVLGRLVHPDDATRDERAATERVESHCFSSNGPPSRGDIAILRAEREPGKPPFWLATVNKYHSPSADILAYHEHKRAAAEFPRQHPDHPPGDPRAIAPAYPDDEMEEEYLLQEAAAAEKAKKAKDKKAKASKDLLEQPAADIFEYTHLSLDYWQHVEPAPRRKRPAPVLRKPPPPSKRARGSSAAPASGRLALSAKARKAAIQRPKICDEQKEDEYDQGDCSADDMSDAGDSDYSPAAAAAAASEAEESDPDEEMPVPSCAARPLSAAASARSSSIGISAIPAAELETWRKLRYVQPASTSGSELISVSSVIWWGKSNKILTGANRIAAPAWKMIVQDLGQARA